MAEPLKVEKCAECLNWTKVDAMTEVEFPAGLRKICPNCLAQIEAQSRKPGIQFS